MRGIERVFDARRFLVIFVPHPAWLYSRRVWTCQRVAVMGGRFHTEFLHHGVFFFLLWIFPSGFE
jgi:hypothetical protein